MTDSGAPLTNKTFFAAEAFDRRSCGPADEDCEKRFPSPPAWRGRHMTPILRRSRLNSRVAIRVNSEAKLRAIQSNRQLHNKRHLIVDQRHKELQDTALTDWTRHWRAAPLRGGSSGFGNSRLKTEIVGFPSSPQKSSGKPPSALQLGHTGEKV